MPLCRFSSGSINNNKVFIDNLFLTSFMPYAPENCTKVYLLGFLYCQDSASSRNNVEHFENLLGIDRLELIDCFRYWEEKNLVAIKSTDPLEVMYLPVDGARSIGKYNEKKYAPFVDELRSILNGREILTSEICHYVDFLEEYNMQGSDFNMIVKYCVSKKGPDINSNYILTVARIWADEGVRTAEKIEEKIETLTMLSGDISKVAKALKYRGNLSIEHQQYFIRWTKNLGYSLSTIMALCDKVAQKSSKNAFEYLDKLLTKYYEMKLMSVSEIEEYEANKVELTALARDINRALGIYYESVDSQIDTYIIPWMNRGVKSEALLQIADFCFKNSIKTLEGMDDAVQKFSKLGLNTVSAINGYLEEVVNEDNRIKEILNKLSLDRRVNNFDRSFYRTWTLAFSFSDEIIDYAVSLSVGKGGMNYVNAILNNWHESGLKTLKEVQSSNITAKEKKDFERKSFSSYSAENVSALFDNLDEIKFK